jgi:hypothetical protein
MGRAVLGEMDAYARVGTTRCVAGDARCEACVSTSPSTVRPVLVKERVQERSRREACFGAWSRFDPATF